MTLGRFKTLWKLLIVHIDCECHVPSFVFWRTVHILDRMTLTLIILLALISLLTLIRLLAKGLRLESLLQLKLRVAIAL